LLSYDQTMQEFIDNLASILMLFQPGARWNYSVAVDVLGIMCSRKH